MPPNPLGRKAIQEVLTEHLVCSQHRHQSLVEVNKTPSGGEDVESLDPSPTVGGSPVRKGFSCTWGPCTGLWHLRDHLCTTQQTSICISQKPDPWVENDTITIAERDFGSSPSVTSSF